MLQQVRVLSSVMLLTTASLGFSGTMGDKNSSPNLNLAGSFALGFVGGFSALGSLNLQPGYGPGYSLNWGTLTNTDWKGNLESGGVLGAFIAYQYNQNVQFSLDYRYRGDYGWQVNGINPVDTTLSWVYRADNINIQTLMVNVKLAPTSCCDNRWTPYIMGV